MLKCQGDIPEAESGEKAALPQTCFFYEFLFLFYIFIRVALQNFPSIGSGLNVKSSLFSALLLVLLLGETEISAEQKYWVFLADKGVVKLEKSSRRFAEIEARLSHKAIDRRKKTLGAQNIFDLRDAPLNQRYVKQLENDGVKALRESRWLNAFSTFLSQEQVVRISKLPFVKKIQPVRKLAPPDPVHFENPLPFFPKTPFQTRLDYGDAFTQIAQINVHFLHDAGIIGQGVLIGMLDTGFDYSDHEAFQELQVLDEYDFINMDEVTANQEGDVTSQISHGTRVLSAIGAYAPGQLIGPAYGSQFLLAKTEDITSETPIEEDNWAAAIEWMELQGADVISSSLGYSVFDDPADNYSLADLDGKTTIVSQAAQIATEKGMVVVNSAGNRGNSATWSKIIAPADAKDILAAGGLIDSGARVSFSSFGPTADGRIKPDVMAMAAGVKTAAPGPGNVYQNSSGTSMSCPLVAGVAAQILSAHPDLTPLQVNEAIRMTASQAATPDTVLGYGTLDAAAAITYWGPAFSNQPAFERLNASEVQTSVHCLAKTEIQSATFFWRRPREGAFSETPMTLLDSTSLESAPFALKSGESAEVYFSVRLQNDDRIYTYPKLAPEQLFRIDADGIVASILNSDDGDELFSLLPSYPNPVVRSQNATPRVTLLLQETAVVSLSIHNLLGQEITTILDQVQLRAGSRTQPWNAGTASVQHLTPGVYFFRAVFETNNKRVIKYRKFMILD